MSHALLGNQNIRLILDHMKKSGECTPTCLAIHLKIDPTSISRYLRQLQDFNLIQFRRDGTTLYYSINQKGAEKHIQQETELLLSSAKAYVDARKNKQILNQDVVVDE